MKIAVKILLVNFVNIFLFQQFILSDVTVAKSTNSNAIKDISATADINEDISPFNAKIEFDEISFKNKNKDYFVFHVENGEKKVNLKGLEFFDDKVFKKIKEDFWVKPKQKIYFYFNSEEKDIYDINNPDFSAKIFSKQKGLAGTTEQLLIKHSKQPLAFFCWFKSPVPTSELKQFQNIVPKTLWEKENIESCFSSEKVKTNQILIKIRKGNNKDAWEIAEESQNLSKKHIESKNNTKNETIVKDKVKDKISQKKKTSKNSVKKQKTSIENIIKSGGKTNKKAIPNISITEIFPSPTGKSDFEWIELKNEEDKTINLENWILDDSEGGSKAVRLGKHIIKPGEFAQINMKNYKITLNNKTDSVRLFLPDGSPVSEKEYDQAKKGFSYAKIIIDNEEKWQWTLSPTPGKQNPILTSINGEIIKTPKFGEIYSFTIKNIDNEDKILVIFDEEVIKAPLAKEIFKIGVRNTFIGEITKAPPTNKGNFSHIMKLYEYGDAGENSPASPTPPKAAPYGAALGGILAASAILGGGGYFYFKGKQNPNPNTQIQNK